jgi:single-stranded-DNA-specific exonuclease
MPSKRWLLPQAVLRGHEELAASLGVPPIIAQILMARGVETDACAARFLDPQVDHLHDPFLLPDALPAVERLARAIREGEKILVHGDYDVDGVCAAALLTRVLRVLKADVDVFVPHRRVDGYDLQPETVRKAAADGVKLIVTVDCGIVAFEAALAAKELGIDLIVTDHHELHPGGDLPQALAVVNPKRPGSRYPFSGLCGTGVAYKLSCALVQHLQVPSRAFQTTFLDLVALATCADCMPLVDENRVFVKHGLETLRHTNKAGLKSLMRVAGLNASTLTTRSLGFVLGPRINAVGRLDASEYALKLLLTGDASEADALAERLEAANRERQQQQERMLQDALRQAERFVDDRILVLASHNWHPGIIGIVASKIAETLCRPTVMVAIDEENDSARGSCRSVEGFHVYDALNACRELLIRCGGHQAAAGFEIDPKKVEPFRQAMQEIGRRELDDDLLQPSVRIDAELPCELLNMGLAQELARLEPYGHGNHEPVFVTRSLNVLEQRRLANKAQLQVMDHLKLRLQAPASRRGVEALFWRAWPRAEECPVNGRIDACYTLQVQTYNDLQTLQLNLRDFSPSG